MTKEQQWRLSEILETCSYRVTLEFIIRDMEIEIESCSRSGHANLAESLTHCKNAVSEALQVVTGNEW